MLTGAHFLLTYTCNFECDDCFVYSSPQAPGTFTIRQLQTVFEELDRIGSVKTVYFEGGEAFLYYPLMVEGIRIARNKGFKVGIVTNAYWATTEEDAELWLKPLHELGIADLSLSEDMFHSEDIAISLTKQAQAAAKRMDMPVNVITIDRPCIDNNKDSQARGEPVIGGSTMLRGRAVDKLVGGLPTRPWHTFTECPYEDLRHPRRVHLDPYGNVHMCQGISIGNMWQAPLSELISNYNCDSHPISRPIMEGGPAQLAKEHDVIHEDRYVDACHLCFCLRLALLDRFPEYLAPRQVYGL